MTFRFIHMADVHLDTPFQSLNANLRSLLRDSLREAFRACVDLALQKNVHAVLVAGDLFDNKTLCFQTEKFLISQVRRLGQIGIKLFYAPGNHDPYGNLYKAGRIPWPSNVHIFGSSRPHTLPLHDSEGNVIAYITGAGHESYKEGRNLARLFPPARGTVPQIGLLHTMVGGANGEEDHERYAPCTMRDLTAKGYTYWALGHIHTRMQLSEKPAVIYPGNLVGRNPREEGPRGAYYVEIDDRGAVTASFYPLAPVCWLTLRNADLSHCDNYEVLERNLYHFIRERLEKDDSDGRKLVRLVLEGPCPLWMELANTENILMLQQELQSSLGLDYVEVVADRLFRPTRPENYRNQPHVLGTALEILENLEKDDKLLMELQPRELAGYSQENICSKRLEYLRSLLKGLDYEIVSRLAGEDANEV